MKSIIIIIITAIIILSLTSSGILECVDKQGLNIARGKSVSQSSAVPTGDAGRAVDGTRSGFCTHTNENDPSPWWFVDLEARHRVSNVTITNRSDYGSRLKDFDVIITDEAPPGGFSSGQVCYSHQGAAADGQVFNLTCRHGEVGRFVGVRLRAPGILTMCEVEIFGKRVAYSYEAMPVSQELKLVAIKPAVSLIECSHWCLGYQDCCEFSFANEECRMYGKDVIAGTPSASQRYKKIW